MKVGIMGVDLLYRPRHRFSNPACMKLSGFYKNILCRTALLSVRPIGACITGCPLSMKFEVGCHGQVYG